MCGSMLTNCIRTSGKNFKKKNANCIRTSGKNFKKKNDIIPNV